MKIQERQIQIMVDIDIPGFIKFLKEQDSPYPESDRVALMAIHKARCRHPKIPDELKEESKRWLIRAGCERL